MDIQKSGESGGGVEQPLLPSSVPAQAGVCESGASGTDGETPQLSTVLLEWREYLEVRDFRPRSVDEYLKNVKRYLATIDSFPDGITEKSLLAYQKKLFYMRPQAPGPKRKRLPADSDIPELKQKSEKRYSIQTQRAAISIVKSFTLWLYARRILNRDPGALVPIPKPSKRLPRNIMDKDEVLRILSAPDLGTPLGYRDRTILEILYSCGIRASELCHLDLTDVDLQQRQMLIRDGKGGRDRQVPISPQSAEFVEGYILNVREKLDRGVEPQALILGKTGIRLIPTTLNITVQRIARKAGIERKINPHLWRHTCATHLTREGAGLRYVQEFLGHSDPRTTMVYTHIAITDLMDMHEKYHPREKL